jgi:hypothetical protein
MPRKPTKPKEGNPIRGATPAREYEIGDQVFFSFAGTAGVGPFIGQLREDATCLVLASSPEDAGLEMPAAYCSPTGHIEPQLGHAYRREYMNRFPKKMLGKV